MGFPIGAAALKYHKHTFSCAQFGGWERGRREKDKELTPNFLEEESKNLKQYFVAILDYFPSHGFLSTK